MNPLKIRIGMACAFAGAAWTLTNSAAAQTRPAPPTPPKAQSLPKTQALPLAYAWKPGTTYRYKTLGVFNGHIPPFASPGSPPIHIRVQLDYLAEAKKQTPQGVEVAFTVENAELFLLEKEPDENGKPPAGSEEVPFPIPVEQVRDALNVTATINPQGAVTSIAGGDANSVRVNFGFELRKLFLLMLPITFPEKPATPLSEWKYEDGLLGKNPGKTFYTARVASGAPAGKRQFSLAADSAISEMTDKNERPTTNAADAVVKTTGTAKLTGNIQFASAGAAQNGSVPIKTQEARFKLQIDVVRKRDKLDPNKPEEPLESRIDVQASLKIQAVEAPIKKPMGDKPAPPSNSAPKAPSKSANGKATKTP